MIGPVVGLLMFAFFWAQPGSLFRILSVVEGSVQTMRSCSGTAAL